MLFDFLPLNFRRGAKKGDILTWEKGDITTLVLHGTENGTDTQKELISDAIKNGSKEKLDDILMAIEETDALNYCYAKAEQHVDKALAAIGQMPASDYRDALEALAKFSLKRKY